MNHREAELLAREQVRKLREAGLSVMSYSTRPSYHRYGTHPSANTDIIIDVNYSGDDAQLAKIVRAASLYRTSLARIDADPYDQGRLYVRRLKFAAADSGLVAVVAARESNIHGAEELRDR